jgi:hypothetical protein
MRSSLTLEMAQALLTLDMFSAGGLPALAAEALGAGLDSEHLRLLAGLAADDPYTAREYFARSLGELGHDPVDKTKAVDLLVRLISEEILADTRRAIEGARLIWKACRQAGRADHDYDPFIYAASEWDDRPADRPMFERAIVEEAKRWARS